MAQQGRSGYRLTARAVILSVVAAIVVVVLLLPISGDDTLPPTCWSAFGYEVPCGSGLAYGAGVTAAVLVGAALWYRRSRRR